MTKIPLASLGGLDGSELAPDIEALSKLSERGRAAIWNVLGPALVTPIPPALEEAARAFAREHGVSDLEMAKGLRALRHVILGSARRNLDVEKLTEDLLRLGMDDQLGRALITRYGEAKKNLREQFAIGALKDHGSLLTHSAVRVDAVLATAEGAELGLVVALMTLGYERQGVKEHVTIQATRGALEELQRAVTAALARMPGG